MGGELFENAEYWRSRAVEARVIAETQLDEAAKNLMLGVAKDYELMAERVASCRTAPNVDGAQSIPATR